MTGWDWRVQAPDDRDNRGVPFYDRGLFFYSTRDGHSWQRWRNPVWLAWIETGVRP